MTGPTRPSKPLSVNALLVIAALCATASVLVVPKPADPNQNVVAVVAPTK